MKAKLAPTTPIIGVTSSAILEVRRRLQVKFVKWQRIKIINKIII